MQVGTSGEYCPNGCGWNERIKNYRILVSPPISASDHTESSKESKPCPFCAHTALCLWDILLNDLYMISKDIEDDKEIMAIDCRIRNFIRAKVKE